MTVQKQRCRWRWRTCVSISPGNSTPGKASINGGGMSVREKRVLGSRKQINPQRLRRIWGCLQGAPKGAYLLYVTFGATRKTGQKTSKIVDLFVSGALNCMPADVVENQSNECQRLEKLLNSLLDGCGHSFSESRSHEMVSIVCSISLDLRLAIFFGRAVRGLLFTFLACFRHLLALPGLGRHALLRGIACS